MNRASSILAARLGIRQVEAGLRADRAADQADAAVARVWKEILTLLRASPHWGEGGRRVATIFAGLLPAVAGDVAAALTRTIVWGQRSAAAAIVGSVPPRALHYAAARQALQPVRESRQLLEAVPTVSDILFPRFSDDLISRILYGRAHDGASWIDRLAGSTRLATPGMLARILAGGLAAGRSSAEIARDLLPAVNGVRSTARRIARTETMRVAGAAQMECHAQLGDLVVAYQAHATLDQFTRPWHAARSGTLYYLHPKPGQKGMAQCPHPPVEADGSISWNCRCYLSPVLREPENAAAIPRAVVPDPLTYAAWFDRADDRTRRATVGAKRYALVYDQTDKPPEWSDFLDARTGDLMRHAKLAAETPAERARRASVVRDQLAKRRAALAQASAVGFVMET